MRSLLLPVLLLCVCVAQVQMQDNSHALRLCGREFLRAVVYSCGGSRWRRFTGEQDTLLEGKYCTVHRDCNDYLKNKLALLCFCTLK